MQASVYTCAECVTSGFCFSLFFSFEPQIHKERLQDGSIQATESRRVQLMVELSEQSLEAFINLELDIKP